MTQRLRTLISFLDFCRAIAPQSTQRNGTCELECQFLFRSLSRIRQLIQEIESNV